MTTMTKTLLLAAALAACTKSDGTPEADSKAEKPTEKVEKKPEPKKPAVAKAEKKAPKNPDPTPAPAPVAVDPKATAPGPAYLGVAGTGLVRVAADGTLKTLVPHNYGIRAIALDPRNNGKAYATAIGGLWSIDGDSAAKLPPPGQYRYLEHLAVGPDGVLWGMDHEGVARWDGKVWTTEPSKTFEARLLDGLAVDKGGHVWVATSDYLWRLDGDKWKRLDGSFAKKGSPFWRTVVAGPSGEVYVTGSAGTFVYQNDSWRELAMNAGYGHVDELAVGPDGRLSGSGGVGDVVIAPPGAQGRPVDFGLAGIKARHADVMALDGNGRTWLRSDNGVIILDGDGKLVAQWTPGTIAGLTGKVEAIAVVGGGPAMPKTGDVARGSVAGKVIHAGKAVGGAVVEICDSPAMMFTTSPCDETPNTHRATTAADGSFKITDVPVGSYGFAVKPKTKWLIFLGNGGCCTTIENGGTFDIGAITLDKLE